jgi:hypothetical protein
MGDEVVIWRRFENIEPGVWSPRAPAAGNKQA